MTLYPAGGRDENIQILHLKIHNTKQILWNYGLGLVCMLKVNCFNCTLQKTHGNTKSVVLSKVPHSQWTTVHKEISNQLWTAGPLPCTGWPLILTHLDAYHLAKCPRWRYPRHRPIPELYGKVWAIVRTSRKTGIRKTEERTTSYGEQLYSGELEAGVPGVLRKPYAPQVAGGRGKFEKKQWTSLSFLSCSCCLNLSAPGNNPFQRWNFWKFCLCSVTAANAEKPHSYPEGKGGQ